MGQGRHRMVRAAFVAVLVAAGTAVIAVTPGAAQEEDLWFSPDVVAAGDAFDVGGTCDLSEGAVQPFAIVQSAGGAYPWFFAEFDVDVDGQFEGTVDVPPEMPAGDYTVQVACALIVGAPEGSPVDVLQSVEGALEVLAYDGEVPVGVDFDPDEAAHGESVTVSGACIMGDAQLVARVTGGIPPGPADVEMAFWFQLDLRTEYDGWFETTFEIESNQQPGDYTTEKWCTEVDGGRGYVVPGGTLTVLDDAEPPPPVPTTPRFTG